MRRPGAVQSRFRALSSFVASRDVQGSQINVLRIWQKCNTLLT